MTEKILPNKQEFAKRMTRNSYFYIKNKKVQKFHHNFQKQIVVESIDKAAENVSSICKISKAISKLHFKDSESNIEFSNKNV